MVLGGVAVSFERGTLVLKRRDRDAAPGDHLFISEVLSHTTYLLISFRKSTSPQNRQLIIHYYRLEYQVGCFVGELTFQNHLIDTLCEIKSLPSSFVTLLSLRWAAARSPGMKTLHPFLDLAQVFMLHVGAERRCPPD